MNLYLQGANHDSEDGIEDPDEEFIRQELSDEDFEFGILVDEPDTFIQCAITGTKNRYVLEYQDGSTEQHFQAEKLVSLSRAISAFIWYLRGDPSWHLEFVWERIAI